jgi:DNA-binding transcriptional MerR regulator
VTTIDDIEFIAVDTHESQLDLDSLSTGFMEVGSPEENIHQEVLQELVAEEATLVGVATSAVDGNSEVAKNEAELVIDLSEIARMVPNKMAFKIGEVAEITGLKTYVLRYWESEFEALNPQKSAFNQRMYSRRDVETVLLIKKLLYEEKFSIAGAKKKLKEVRRELKSEKQIVEVQSRVESAVDSVAELVEEIANLKRLFI